MSVIPALALSCLLNVGDNPVPQEQRERLSELFIKQAGIRAHELAKSTKAAFFGKESFIETLRIAGLTAVLFESGIECWLFGTLHVYDTYNDFRTDP